MPINAEPPPELRSNPESNSQHTRKLPQTGQVEVTVKDAEYAYHLQLNDPPSIDEFELLEAIGEGMSATVSSFWCILISGGLGRQTQANVLSCGAQGFEEGLESSKT